MSRACFILLVLNLHGAKSDVENTTAIDRKLCTIPHPPQNGAFESKEDRVGDKPGDKVDRYDISFTCNPGYKIRGGDSLLCLNGLKDADTIPECLPICKVEGNVVSIPAAGERCILDGPEPTDAVALRGIRPQPEDICGIESTTVTSSDRYDVVTVISRGWQAHSGSHIETKEAPWHVGVFSKSFSPFKQICGGTVVSKKVVVSAAHCFWNDLTKKQAASMYAVAAGKIYRPYNNPKDVRAQKRDVQDIRIPPRFQGSATNLQDDIALVIVSEHFEYTLAVRPACLDFSPEAERRLYKEGSSGKIAGWGLTGENAPAAQILNLANLPYVDIEDCIKGSHAAFLKSITSDKICAGHTNGTAVCHGDSGGGLAFSDGERYYLRGVVSSAPDSDQACNVYTWAAFTDVGRHERFITGVLKEFED